MRQKIKITMLSLLMLVLSSCIEETTVLNIVHDDGSITRKVTMKGDEKNIDPESYRVPLDSSWQITYTFELGEKNDTTWILSAEKTFAGADEITREYLNDGGANRSMKRSANFEKNFRWFTTVFRYTESIEKALTVDLPLADFFNEEELKYLSMPQRIQEELESGPDSTRVKMLADSLDDELGRYLVASFVKQWMDIFSEQVKANPVHPLDMDRFRAREPEFISDLYVEADLDGFDIDSFIVQKLGKEFVSAFGPEIDSSVSMTERMAESFFNANEYDLGIVMPGKIIATSGYARTDSLSDAGEAILWKVDGTFFLTQDYNMWSESRINNYSIWILTAVFILFVIFGLTIRSKSRQPGSNSK